MKKPPGGLLLAWPCLMAAALWAQPAAGPFETRERLGRPLGPLAEKALATLVDEAEPLQHKLLTEHMRVLIEDMQVVFALTETERSGLSLDAASMVALASRQWKACALAGLRLQVAREGDDAAMAAWVADRWRASSLVPYHVVEGWTPPEKLTHWAKALEKRLGTQRAAQWLQVREDQRRKLVPVIEAFLRGWAAACRAPLDERLDGHLRMLGAAADLPPQDRETLAARLRLLVDEHVAVEMEAGRDMLGSVPDQSLELVLSVYNMACRFALPTEEEVDTAWRRLARSVAGEERMRLLAAAEEQQKTERARRIEALLEPSLRMARIDLESGMDVTVDNMIAALNLDDERRVKLEALAASAVKDGLEAARLAWTQHIAAREKAGVKWEDMAEVHSIRPEHQADARGVWKDGVKKLFSEAEIWQWRQDGQEIHKERLGRALAKAAVAEADWPLALDSRQRPLLEAVLASRLTTMMGNGPWEFQGAEILAYTRDLPQETVRGILDEAQMERLPALGLTAAESAFLLSPASTRTGGNDAQTDTISSYLHARAVRERAELLRHMLFRVEDARRALRLSPEKAARLTTAAKGAVEAAMASWREKMESLALSEAGAAGAELAGVLVAARNAAGALKLHSPAREPVWREAVGEVLSQQEQDQWQKEMVERGAYRVAALVEVTTAELARRYRLTEAQCEKMRKMLPPVIAKTVKDIEDQVTAAEPWCWHLQCSGCLMPLAGLPKAELRAVLTRRQWNHLEEQDMATAKEVWDYLQNAVSGRPPKGGRAVEEIQPLQERP